MVSAVGVCIAITTFSAIIFVVAAIRTHFCELIAFFVCLFCEKEENLFIVESIYFYFCLVAAPIGAQYGRWDCVRRAHPDERRAHEKNGGQEKRRRIWFKWKHLA